MKERKNVYTCSRCGNTTVTVELCEGVTLASITCQLCNGTAWSAFYPESVGGEPELFWFKPSNEGVKKQTRWELHFSRVSKKVMSVDEAIPLQQEHVNMGGLLLAPSRKKADEWSR